MPILELLSGIILATSINLVTSSNENIVPGLLLLLSGICLSLLSFMYRSATESAKFISKYSTDNYSSNKSSELKKKQPYLSITILISIFSFILAFCFILNIF